jgi:outer membrane lipoprotein-sorting protein
MNRLDRTLESFGAREPDAEAVNSAQRKLDAAVAAKMAARPVRPARAARGWLAAGASALVAAVAVIWLPLGTAPALAFAQVQQHFRDFRTLRFDLDQRMNGKPLMNARVSVRHDGSVRTELGNDVVVVVNSTEMRVLTLVKSARMAVVSPLVEAAKKEDALKWLDDIRDFQGVAQALPGSRIIGGQRAYGWSLDIGGGNIELWANEAGLPLEMTLNQGVDIKMDFDFEFDVTFPEDHFSTKVPDGYRLGEED